MEYLQRLFVVFIQHLSKADRIEVQNNLNFQFPESGHSLNEFREKVTLKQQIQKYRYELHQNNQL